MTCRTRMYSKCFHERPIGFLLVGVVLSSTACTQTLQENFEDPLSPIGSAMVRHPLVDVAKGLGLGDTDAIKVLYQGHEHGRKRVLVSSSLPRPAKAYTLSFAVKFCEGFDFAKGGKLHGLGPRKPVAGGKPVTPMGWSARLMFRPEGGLMTYVYHQDMPGKYGHTSVAPNFKFVPGQYYRVEMRVALNDPASAANGTVEVSVDGQELIKHTGLRFRAVEGQDGLIQTLMFNTFHGGNAPEWAPRTVDGAFKTDCAYFDDLLVKP